MYLLIGQVVLLPTIYDDELILYSVFIPFTSIICR